jgi:hypothetical protein
MTVEEARNMPTAGNADGTMGKLLVGRRTRFEFVAGQRRKSLFCD